MRETLFTLHFPITIKTFLIDKYNHISLSLDQQKRTNTYSS